MFDTCRREYGENKSAYPDSIVLLAYYAYKDDSGYHEERPCREQFLAGLRSKEFNCNLANFCDESADVN